MKIRKYFDKQIKAKSVILKVISHKILTQLRFNFKKSKLSALRVDMEFKMVNFVFKHVSECQRFPCNFKGLAVFNSILDETIDATDNNN